MSDHSVNIDDIIAGQYRWIADWIWLFKYLPRILTISYQYLNRRGIRL